ncbi:hypothetical protein MAR_016317 [Mya arenaria]|uniref:Uncharacterized protein n=1 Tax=Mya arenaria TaxID=6604 RepID=A0ABY7FNS3_MYAAR|nr:hypothetical protein MAR_016317 [Mya arenaria]
MEKVSERKIEMFRRNASYYKIYVKDIEVRYLQNILKYLKTFFQSIIDKMVKDIPSNDLVRISLNNPELDFPIVLPFMPRSSMTVERILSEIERVLQSYEQFVVDETFDLSQYEGLVKCKVLPPRGLYVPLLPAKCNGKFVGHAVKTISKQTATIRRRIVKYHNTTKSQKMAAFSPNNYVNTFLKVKQEASGWPDWCVNEESKQTYIQQRTKKASVSIMTK